MSHTTTTIEALATTIEALAVYVDKIHNKPGSFLSHYFVSMTSLWLGITNSTVLMEMLVCPSLYGY